MFNPIGSLQFCMANEGIPTDRAQTHIGPVWESVRTIWIRELMERDEETKTCYSDNFPEAPFKHLRHLSPSLMLPNFDFLLLMRLYIQIAPSISFSVCVFVDGSPKSHLKHLKHIAWFSKHWEIYLTKQNGRSEESCHCSDFTMFKNSDDYFGKL